ncbi:hypothetical protein JCM11641_004708 [Rhodosporidiobolus odoratus]
MLVLPPLPPEPVPQAHLEATDGLLPNAALYHVGMPYYPFTLPGQEQFAPRLTASLLPPASEEDGGVEALSWPEELEQSLVRVWQSPSQH